MSFFKTLFDFSFSEYVTTKIIRFLYVITIILAALTWIGVLIYSFTQHSALAVVGAIIICPLAFLLQVIFTRVGYEILIVVFGIAEHTRDMAWALTGGRKAPPVAPPAQPQYPAYTPQPPTAPQQPYPQYPQTPPQPPQQPPAASQYPQYPQYPQPPQPPQPGK